MKALACLLLVIAGLSIATSRLPDTQAVSVEQPATDAQKKEIWPGMWLFSRDNKEMIHINSKWTREGGVPALIFSLNAPDPGIRENAASWLGAIGTPAKDALPELRKLLEDSDADVRKAAANAMQRIEADLGGR